MKYPKLFQFSTRSRLTTNANWQCGSRCEEFPESACNSKVPRVQLHRFDYAVSGNTTRRFCLMGCELAMLQILAARQRRRLPVLFPFPPTPPRNLAGPAPPFIGQKPFAGVAKIVYKKKAPGLIF